MKPRRLLSRTSVSGYNRGMIQPKRVFELLILPSIWAMLVFAALQTKRLVAGPELSVCGPWGCGPETGALLAMHSLWLAVLGPPLIYFPLRMNLTCRSIYRLAMGLVAFGAVGMLITIAWQWLVWLPRAGVWSKDYIWQRCGFAIATMVDLPLIPAVILGGVLCCFSAVRAETRRCKIRTAENSSNDKKVVSDG